MPNDVQEFVADLYQVCRLARPSGVCDGTAHHTLNSHAVRMVDRSVRVLGETDPILLDRLLVLCAAHLDTFPSFPRFHKKEALNRLATAMLHRYNSSVSHGGEHEEWCGLMLEAFGVCGIKLDEVIRKVNEWKEHERYAKKAQQATQHFTSPGSTLSMESRSYTTYITTSSASIPTYTDWRESAYTTEQFLPSDYPGFAWFNSASADF